MQCLGACEQHIVRPRASGKRVMARQLPAGSGFRNGSPLLGAGSRAARAAPVKVRAVLEMEKPKDLSGNGAVSAARNDPAAIKQDILLQAKYTVGAPLDKVSPKQTYQATAYSVAGGC